jgi:hypothetical protein
MKKYCIFVGFSGATYHSGVDLVSDPVDHVYFGAQVIHQQFCTQAFCQVPVSQRFLLLLLVYVRVSFQVFLVSID